ncbi:MAG: DUF4886 domain-containing protein [Victivallales bacterium]|nr:DUF4886 domain-containing protein [Victivallales bacterium]
MSRNCMQILTLGNSYTWSLRSYFPAVVASVGDEVKLEFANFGGCELARHWSYITAEERDERCRIYDGGNRKLRDILASRPWDIVTIQQSSRDCWRLESFEPYTANIIAYIRTHAPGAEIVIQQTWAYRADHPHFLPGSAWDIDQPTMFRLLTECNRTVAQRYGLRLIPTGLAVELSRRGETAPFVNYEPQLPAPLHWPDLPPQAGDVVGQCHWRKNPATGELEIDRDLIHLNARGEYLQACVWLATLFQRPTAAVTFVPDEIGNADAAFLRTAAQQAVDEYR